MEEQRKRFEALSKNLPQRLVASLSELPLDHAVAHAQQLSMHPPGVLEAPVGEPPPSTAHEVPWLYQYARERGLLEGGRPGWSSSRGAINNSIRSRWVRTAFENDPDASFLKQSEVLTDSLPIGPADKDGWILIGEGGELRARLTWGGGNNKNHPGRKFEVQTKALCNPGQLYWEQEISGDGITLYEYNLTTGKSSGPIRTTPYEMVTGAVKAGPLTDGQKAKVVKAIDGATGGKIDSTTWIPDYAPDSDSPIEKMRPAEPPYTGKIWDEPGVRAGLHILVTNIRRTELGESITVLAYEIDLKFRIRIYCVDGTSRDLIEAIDIEFHAAEVTTDSEFLKVVRRDRISVTATKLSDEFKVTGARKFKQ